MNVARANNSEHAGASSQYQHSSKVGRVRSQDEIKCMPRALSVMRLVGDTTHKKKMIKCTYIFSFGHI